VNVLVWHVHGSWTTGFVQGRHRYLLPVDDQRGPDGRGRARTWDWPERAVEVRRDDPLLDDVDVVVVQRPEELHHLAGAWLGGREPGRDVPAVYLEHNAPQGRIAELRHPAADRSDLVLVHVTAFNALFWDAGSTRVRVVEHGVPDPGHRYRGDLPRAAVVINEPVRRGRVTGTDLLARLGHHVPIDLFGMGAAPLGGYEDLAQWQLHDEMARRRVYLHPNRWTSLGLSLIEAMTMGMPVVAVATTDAAEVVPLAGGFASTDVDKVAAAARSYLAEPERGREDGARARRYALERFGLARFLADWDDVLEEVVA
jgi:glycosyltransferase involved in cell wall biosynthesis